MVKNKARIIEFIKFAIAGIINTGIDFLALNLLIYTIGLGVNDSHYAVFKVISFTLAVTNSFFLNKLWVFRKQTSTSKAPNEVVRFISVSLIGLMLNILVSSYIFKFGPNFIPLSTHAWANIGALSGTIIVFIWNFIGYKIFVFKTNPSIIIQS